MKKNIFLTFLIMNFVSPMSFAKVRLVLSAALTDKHFELRKQQYIRSFVAVAQFGHNDVYVIEAIKKKGPTFLDHYCKNVFYATTNNPLLKNYGINEATTLYEGICHFNFDPNDMIIKMTGRYELISDIFLKTVEANMDADVIVKNFHNIEDVFSSKFAMKCKYFKEMVENLDFQKMENKKISFEKEINDYIKMKLKKGNFKVLYVDKLGIKMDQRGSTCNWGGIKESFFRIY